MAKKRQTSRNRRSSQKSPRKVGRRETLKTRSATFYARRMSKGRFKEMDESGRSLSADRRQRAKRRTRPGQGDRGDRKAA